MTARRRPMTPPLRPLALAVALLAAPAGAAAAGPPAPTPWLKSLVEDGRKLAERRAAAGTPAEAKWRADAKALIDGALDWTELTREAYGKQWKTLTPGEQSEFAQLLREMIEASYQSKLRRLLRGDAKKPATVQLDWLEEKVEGNEGDVSVRVKADQRVAVLGFRARFDGARWRVWDVAIDEVSTVRTYRAQFGKIVAKDGFRALVERMRTKTEEIRAGKADLVAE